MQTFILYRDIERTAEVLDTKRLGKQRVEAIQIARKLLDFDKGKGWCNHPAVKMWKNYEPYLVKIYIRNIMDEWILRGYRNDKCEKHWFILMKHKLVENVKPIIPVWITWEFCRSHKSNLVRKFPEHYRKYFPDVPNNLQYVWPR